jgi:hypothetical protein
MTGLVCTQAACSLQNLDYLRNGERRDGALGGNQETGTFSPDMASRDGTLLDTTHWDSAGLGNFDLDGPILDGLFTEHNQGMDASIPDVALLDGAEPDAPLPDAPANLDSTNPAKLDANSGADTASGGTTGTTDAGTPQGGAGAGGNTAIGGHGGTGGGTGTGGAGGTSLMDGGVDKDTATGGQAGSGTGGATNTGGTGGASLMDGGEEGDTATVEVGMDVGTDTTTCSGVPHAGICWYLGPQGNSCQQVCASHGVPAPEAASHVGTATQGGSNAECKLLLGLLGSSGTPQNGTRPQGGLGCHLYSGAPWWLESPNFSISASDPDSRLVCGCTM